MDNKSFVVCALYGIEYDMKEPEQGVPVRRACPEFYRLDAGKSFSCVLQHNLPRNSLCAFGQRKRHWYGSFVVHLLECSVGNNDEVAD